MGRTWAWLAVCTSYWLVLLSLSRTQLFDIEHNINKVWEWLIVFVVFLLIDVCFVSLAIITPQLSTLFILCLVLWVYMPLREWLSSRIIRRKAASKNKLNKFEKMNIERIVCGLQYKNLDDFLDKIDLIKSISVS